MTNSTEPGISTSTATIRQGWWGRKRSLGAFGFAVRVRRVEVSGRALVRRTAALAGGAACVGLTAMLWVPSVQADTSGTLTWPIAQATKSITVATKGDVSCVNLDLSAANGLSVPNGKCTTSATVTNSGNEGTIRVQTGAFTSAISSIALCGGFPRCTGNTPPSGYAPGLLILPGTNEFALHAGALSSSISTDKWLGPTSITNDTNFNSFGFAHLNDFRNETVTIIGPRDGSAELTSFSVIWTVS